MVLSTFFGPPRPQAMTAHQWLSGGDYGSRRSRAGVFVSEDLALTSAAIWSATRFLCESIGNLPLTLDYRDPKHVESEAAEHPLTKIIGLNASPNPEMGSTSWRIGRLMHQVNWGNGFSEIERETAGDPRAPVVALWPIHPSRVMPETDTHFLNEGYRYVVRNNDGSGVRMKPDEVLHVPGCLSEDGIWGKGIISYARETIGIAISQDRHQGTGLGEGNMPKVVAFVPGMRDREARNSYRQEWREIHGSPDAADIALLPSDKDTRIERLNFSNVDAQFLTGRVFTVQEVARWYKIPPHVLAELTRSTYCMPAETAVLTEDGPKRIADVRVDELVWSRSEDGKLVLAKVEASGCTGEDYVLEIRTSNRTMRCTNGHRVPILRLLPDSPVSRAEQVRPANGYAAFRKYTATSPNLCQKDVFEQSYESLWVEAKDIRVGDYLVVFDSFKDGKEFSYSKVKSAERIPVKFPVYDLTVAGTHTFIADGVLVHNSNIDRQAVDLIVHSLMPWAGLFEEQLAIKLLTPQDRLKYHFRHQWVSLLRGDFAARMQAYEVGLRCGVLTLNQIYRLEGWPTIGPEGEQRFVPVNWTTVERVYTGEAPPGSEEYGAQRGDPKKPPRQMPADDAEARQMLKMLTMQPETHKLNAEPAESGVAAKAGAQFCAPDHSHVAARAVLSDALSRMFTKEANAAIRASKSADWDQWLEAFFQKHEGTLTEALRPACLVLTAAGVEVVVETLAQRLVLASRKALEEAYDSDTREQFAARLTGWATERTAQVVAEVLHDTQ